jgi:predicted nucleotidyltransferase
VNREEIIQKLKEVKSLLREKFGVVKIGLFGSVAREESSKESDVDILIEKEKPLSLIRFVRMKLLLEKRLGKKVDLISLEGLREELREEVEKEVIYV